MKDSYYTMDTIEQQALRLFAELESLTSKKASVYQLQHSALLVLDMQAYFLDESSHAYIPSARAILPGIMQLIDEYHAHTRPIFFTQHLNTHADAGMMAVWWRDMLTPQHPLHQVVPEIDTSRGTIIEKSQYDAFFQTPLESMLRAAGVTQLVCCGVMTHLCCETTARSAFMRGFEVFFPIDGTATYNLDFHRASLLNLAHGFAHLVLVKDILAAIRGNDAA